MNIAIVLVHNKGDQGDFDQIEKLKSFVTKVTDTHDELNDNDEVIGSYNTYHYEINSLGFPHELRLFQIIPFGVTMPKNIDEIDSHKVIYGKGDEDKTGDHPRFFNWGLKRGTDYGANVVIHLDNASKFDPVEIAANCSKVEDPKDPTHYIESASTKVVSLDVLKGVGQLDETKSLEVALTDYKQDLAQAGFVTEDQTNG